MALGRRHLLFGAPARPHLPKHAWVLTQVLLGGDALSTLNVLPDVRLYYSKGVCPILRLLLRSLTDGSNSLPRDSANPYLCSRRDTGHEMGGFGVCNVFKVEGCLMLLG